MIVHAVQQGDFRLLINEKTGNVLQVGRTGAERVIRELRRHGYHPYPLRFAPTIYNVGLADDCFKALALRDLHDIRQAAIRRILAADAPEVVPQ